MSTDRLAFPSYQYHPVVPDIDLGGAHCWQPGMSLRDYTAIHCLGQFCHTAKPEEIAQAKAKGMRVEMKMHRVVLYVKPLNGNWEDPEDVRISFENVYGHGPEFVTVGEMSSHEIGEWSDEHPLNKIGADHEEWCKEKEEGAMSEQTCGTCKHWTPCKNDDYAHPDFGTCGLAKPLVTDSLPNYPEDWEAGEENTDEEWRAEAIAKRKQWDGLQMVAADGSGYFAALLTRNSHACKEWEGE